MGPTTSFAPVSVQCSRASPPDWLGSFPTLFFEAWDYPPWEIAGGLEALELAQFWLARPLLSSPFSSHFPPPPPPTSGRRKSTYLRWRGKRVTSWELRTTGRGLTINLLLLFSFFFRLPVLDVPLPVVPVPPHLCFFLSIICRGKAINFLFSFSFIYRFYYWPIIAKKKKKKKSRRNTPESTKKQDLVLSARNGPQPRWHPMIGSGDCLAYDSFSPLSFSRLVGGLGRLLVGLVMLSPALPSTEDRKRETS